METYPRDVIRYLILATMFLWKIQTYHWEVLALYHFDVVLFEICLRCPGNVLMGLRGYVDLEGCRDVHLWRRGPVPLRRFGDVPSRRLWVFHLRHTCCFVRTQYKTFQQHCHGVFLAGALLSAWGEFIMINLVSIIHFWLKNCY